MELILQGWIGLNSEGNLGLAEEIDDYYESIAESIMDYFNYTKLNRGLGEKITTIPNANLRCWFSDEKCTLEEAQMNFDSYILTGNLLTQGHYTGYSEWTITGFCIDKLVIGGHDLKTELKEHIGQYIHFILTD